MDKITSFLEGSLIVRWLTIAAHWIDRQWSKSLLCHWLTAGSRTPSIGLGAHLFDRFHGVWYKFFHTLHLDSALEGSIFSRLFLWCSLTALLTPILPTMVVLGLVLLCTLALMVQMGRDRTLRLTRSPVNKWFWAYAVVYFVCSITSVTPSGSLKGGLLTFAFVLFAIVLQGALTHQKQIDHIIHMLVLGAFIVSLIGFAQVLLGVESTTAWVDSSFETVSLRVYATLDNPNVLSEYLLLIIPLGVATTFTAETRRGRASSGIATIAMLLCLALTLSRGGYLGLAAAIALFLVLLDRRFIVLGIVGCACLLICLPDVIIQRLLSITNLADTSTSYRLNIWIATIDMLKDHWLSGIGTGVTAFNAVYPRYSLNAIVAPHSHNLYLQTLVECGITGLVALLGCILSAIRGLATKLKTCTDKKARLQANALLSGLTGFLVQSFTDHSFYNYRVELVFWIIIALCAALSQIENGQHLTNS